MAFRNRKHAGKLLAERFDDLRDREDVIVLALPRGGVPVGALVAEAINAPLDVLVVRKLGVPHQPELAMGAIASGNHIVLDHDLISHFGLSRDAVQNVIDREATLLHEREQRYRGDREFPDLAGATVVLVDDGLATGSTMRVAVHAVRQMKPAAIAVGVPVGAADTVAVIGADVDRIECVESPVNFMAVGRWYMDFRPVTDEDVVAILAGQT